MGQRHIILPVWRRLALLLLLLGCFPGLQAALKWESQELSFEAKPNQHEVTGEFKFTNIGSTPVTIHKVSTNCGCTTAALEKRVYAPGESGSIAATLQARGIGLTSKPIYVETDDLNEQVITLKIAVMVREYATLSNHLLAWKIGDPATPKTSVFEVVHEGPIKLLEALPNKEGFTVAVKELSPGKRYELSVTPSSTAERMHAELKLKTDWPPEQPLEFDLAVAVSQRLTTARESVMTDTLASLLGYSPVLSFSLLGVFCLIVGLIATRWLLRPAKATPTAPTDPANPPESPK